MTPSELNLSTFQPAAEILYERAGTRPQRERPSTWLPTTPCLPKATSTVRPLRAAWRACLSDETRAVLDEDERYFLRQSLSTPCLNAIVRRRRPLSHRRLGQAHSRFPRQQRASGRLRPSESRRRDQGGTRDASLLAPPLRQPRPPTPWRAASSRPRRRGSTRFCSRRAARRRSAWRSSSRATRPAATRRCRCGIRSTAPISTPSASAARPCSARVSGR